MRVWRGAMRRRKGAAWIGAATALVSGRLLAQTTLSSSQTIGNLTTSPLTIDASANQVDITQSPGTTLDLADGGLNKVGSNTASIGGGNIISDTGEIDLDSTGGDFTINSALNGSGLALVKEDDGRVILGSTDATNNNFAGGIYLNGGALQISSDANLGANANNANAINFAGGTLEVAGNVNFSSPRALNIGVAGGTFSVTNSAFTATIDDANQLSGSGTFVKEGAGTLRITSANSIGGSVIVNHGVLELQNTAALAGQSSPAAPIMLNGGQLNLRKDGVTTATFGNDITLGGNATINVDRISTGVTGNYQLGALNIGNSTLTVNGANRTLEFTGTTTVSGASTIDNSVDVRLGGQLTGNGSLTKRGAGVLSLSGIAPNTFADLTEVDEGTLDLNKTAGTNAVPGDLIINGGTVRLLTSGQIDDNANITITTGSLELNNQNDTVSVLHNNGGVFTTGMGSLLVTSPNTTVLASGTTILNGGHLSTTSLLVTGGFNEVQFNGVLSVGTNGMTMSGSSSPKLVLDADPSAPGLLVLQSNVSFTGSSGTASITSSGAEPVAGTMDLAGAMRTFTINDGTSADDMSVAVRVTNGGITKGGPGTLQLTKSNSYAGGTVLQNGTLEITNGAALGTGSVLFQGGTLSILSDGTLSTVSAPISAGATTSTLVNIGTINGSSVGTFMLPQASLGTGLTVGGPGGGTLVVNGAVNLQSSIDVTANSNIAFNGIVSQVGAGTFGITKTGSGMLILGGSGSNSYLGTTTINSGVLQVAKTSGIAIPGSVMINGPSLLRLGTSEQIADSATITMNSALGAASLDLANQTETIGGLTGSGSITLGSGQLIIAAAGSTTFNGSISGSGQVSKSGSAEFILAGANNFTGGSTVGGGTLTYSTASANQSGNTLTGGVWRINDAATLNFATGPGITTSQADVTLSGPGSKFPAFNSIAANSGSFTVTDGRTFITAGGFSNTGSVIVAGGISNSTLTISGAVSQLPGTTLSGGTWTIQSGGNLIFASSGNILTNAANVTLSGSASNFSSINNLSTNQGRFTITSGRAFSTTGGYTNSGTTSIGASSVLSINGTLTNTGTVDISGGLILNYSGATPIAAVRSALASGFANGSWTGNGINSVSAALIAANPSSAHKIGVGYAEASALGVTGTGSFMGQPDDNTCILLSPALFGDANLDGSVNSMDFDFLAAHFGQSSQAWTAGDANYDGIVNTLDFNALATNYGQSFATPSGSVAAGISVAALGIVVPEPATALVVMSVGLILGRHSRRRRNPLTF